jgi:predicted PurR-regulated permease PerM
VTEIYHSGHPTVAKKRRAAPIRKPYVPRVISFIVLLAIILLVGAIFFQVMAQFIVPLFLAGVLLVVFQPLHAWTLNRLPGHPRVCAALTTVLILLVVLLPLTWLGWKAYVDFRAMLAPSTQRPAIHQPATAAVPSARAPSNQQAASNQTATLPATTADGTAAEPGDHKAALATKLWNLADDFRHRVEDLAGVEILEEDMKRMVNRATTMVGSWLLTGVQSAIGVLISLAIMVISLYYFLADGPTMIRAVMHLSPLDSRYERELLERFGQVSRAVVVATLLSAVVQGALAGIGYYFALPKEAPIFLLTALTMVTAMVPFVGAAAVWICVCGWVYLYGERVVDGVTTHDGNWVTALVLAVYCTIVVSGIDNVIKPFVLHGQSKLHPLLALLSILGGVTVLGPIGILVGPMLVSFLQALLAMLRKELDSFGAEEGESALQLAAIVEGNAISAVENAVSAAPSKSVGGDSNSEVGAREKAPKAQPVAAKAAERRGWKRRRKR